MSRWDSGCAGQQPSSPLKSALDRGSVTPNLDHWTNSLWNSGFCPLGGSFQSIYRPQLMWQDAVGTMPGGSTGIFSPSGLLRIIGKSLFHLRGGRKMKGVLCGDSGGNQDWKGGEKCTQHNPGHNEGKVVRKCQSSPVYSNPFKVCLSTLWMS